jgi:hypothetical protein
MRIAAILKIVIWSCLLATALVLLYTLPARSMGIYPFFQKGMSYATWNKESFGTVLSDNSLKAMADLGVNCVSIVTTWYQEDYNSVKMNPTERTPSDSSIRHAIRKAHEAGMSVMLKPHIDLEGGRDCSRSDIGFQTEEKWSEWFSNYTNFIIHYARLAEKEGVELFCVGTELSFAATKSQIWREVVIPGVRKVFSGQLTYAANWDEYRDVAFWDVLDYAGIDAYFPLSKKPNPTFEDIKEGWKSWLGEIEEWQKKTNKPIIFTECGYPSADHAAIKPWEEPVAGAANIMIQADCYRAVFETFWDKSWFYGVYWWNWNTYAGSGGSSNRHFTPQNKPAAECVKTWYAQPVEKRLVPAGGDKPKLPDAEIVERLKIGEIKQKQDDIAKERKIYFNGEMAGKGKPRDRYLNHIKF